MHPNDEPQMAALNVGLAVDSTLDFDSVKTTYESAGDVVVFIEPSAVFDYEAGLLGIMEDGALFAIKSADGVLQFPSLAEPEVLIPDRTITVDALLVD